MEDRGGPLGPKQPRRRTDPPASPSRMSATASVGLLLLTLSFMLSAAHAALESYGPVEFLGDVETQFNHFDVDQRTGNIYIGAKNYLYHLKPDLSQHQRVSTEPECERQCENFNRILAVASSPVDRLLTCESYSGKCQLRNLTDISSSEESSSVIVNPLTSAVGVLGPGAELYAGVSPEYDPDSSIAYVTKWTILPSFNDEVHLNSPTNDAKTQEFQMNFINGFQYSGYTYYVTNQQQLVYNGVSVIPVDDYPYVSKLNRVCQTSEESGFTGFTEFGLECSGPEYNLIQAIDISSPGGSLDESFMFALFAKGDVNSNTPMKDSVLCAYSTSALKDKFVDTVHKCLTEGNDYGAKNLQFSCSTLNVQLDYAEDNQCESDYFTYASATEPLKGEALLMLPGNLTTSIRVVSEENETVAFIGTSDGHVLKVHIKNSTYARKYEDIEIGSTAVQQDTYYDNTTEQITFLTEQKLIRLSVANCSQYTSCKECIGVQGEEDGDPYCGWCTLEARCSRYRDCASMDQSTRWLSYSTGQCAGITNTSVGFSIPRSTPQQTINISVSQLPVPSTNALGSYSCQFGDDFESAVTALDSQQVMCETPPQDRIPAIPNGESAVTVALSIFSHQTQTAFVKADFMFYDCALISSCGSCMTSPWACDWCIYDNKCTHDSSTCDAGDVIIRTEDPEAADKCPKIFSPDKQLYLPVGQGKSFVLKAKNLPTEQSKVIGYKCKFNIEGEEVEAGAIALNESLIECQETPKGLTYSSQVFQMQVALRVTWNYDFPVDDDGMNVTLYNCSIDHDSCSRCLSPAFTSSDLDCRWCGNTCAYKDTPVCSAPGIVPKIQSSSATCDGPVVTDISPRDGPIEGNTVVTITGTDIGQEFSEITEVRIGNAECNLDGMEQHYDPGRSVRCRTSPNAAVESAQATITVNSLPGTGGPLYNYVNPSIDSFSPTKGLAAGGTQVVVDGDHLDAGNGPSAMFGNASCRITSLTKSSVICMTSESEPNLLVPLTMSFDGASRASSTKFTFVPNPIIGDISTTKTIEAGGSLIDVRGTGFDVIQKAIIRATVTENGEDFSTEESCMPSTSSILLQCPSPAAPTVTQPYSPVKRRRRETPLMIAKLTFDFDGYELAYGDLTYYHNPEYHPFKENKEYTENVVISGRYLDEASVKEDVLVYVGNANATVISLGPDTLIIQPPPSAPGKGDLDNSTDTNLAFVKVKHGKLSFDIGYIDYPDNSNDNMMLISIIAAIGGTILVVVIIVVMVCKNSQKKYEDELRKVQHEMQDLEEAVKTEATKAFFDIQQDMSGIKDQLQEFGGMPFVTGQDYIRNMLFVGLNVQPMINDPQLPEENLKRAMVDFSKLLSNKDFLLVFIRSLDESSALQMRDRHNIASLLTVVLVLEGKLPYLSDVMLTLMSEQISNAADNDRYRQLFRRTESIVEKLLANWMALCMYTYLQKHVAYPLYMLYQAIKFQVEKGPIDIITGNAHYSLNYEFLLDEDIEFNEVTMNVENKMQKSETTLVKVLDVDTITQVKEKVLDAMFRNKPQSERYTQSEVDLVLRSGNHGKLVLRDTDNTTDKSFNRWAKVNTIRHYGITTESKPVVAIVCKQDNPNASLPTPLNEDDELLPSPASPKRGAKDLMRANTNVESDLEEGTQFYHLTQLYEEEASKKSKRGLGKSSSSGPRVKHRKIREIYLRRLVSTKKSVQNFVDDALTAMLSMSDEKPLPKAIKYLFDFLDRQADRHKLKSDTSETWKNSCLPLRFWVTALTHPAYIFDMKQTNTVDACVSVLTQMLDNACKDIVPEYKFETSPSRVLYASELPGYISMIRTFYSQIKDQPRVNIEEAEEEFKEVCQTFQGTFSTIGTLHQLYQFANKHNDTLLEALEEDDQCQRANMGYKLEQVGSTLAQGSD